ncbi:MAG TPA: hypothetical protein VJK90_15585 [Acetobacteraceae bacterium]|jgi:hypothetical protein|nr:hypothetical protein [Acetobacteraceae bacterium]
MASTMHVWCEIRWCEIVWRGLAEERQRRACCTWKTLEQYRYARIFT